MSDANFAFGSFLLMFGAALSLGSHFLLGSIPMVAMGIGIAILGASWILTPSNPTPKKAIKNFMKSSCNNIEALLEALGAMERAIYVPRKDGAFAYVPLRRGEIALAEIANENKLVINRGRSMGIVLLSPSPISSNPTPFENLNELLESALIESGIAESVKAIFEDDSVIVEIENPRLDVDYPRFKLVMGSLPASIAAQAIALALSKPVRIEWEKRDKNNLIVRLRILEWTEKSYT